MRRWATFLALLGALLLIAAGLFIAGWSGSGPATRPTAVLIGQGSSLAAAARQLQAAGLLSSADRFLLQAKLFGGGTPIKAGEYEIPAHASPSAILTLLQSGRTLQRFVAIPEGLPSIMVYERLMRAPSLTGSVPVPAEGSVLPDSYSYQRGESRSALLRRMQQAMTRELDKLWAKRQPGAVVTTPQAAVILASIVEKETGKPSERRLVAGVYSNRLRIGMPLQADPTTIYPITHGKPLGRRLRRSEVHAVNPYNTYVIAGLPVGPIANPGRASIAAVLDPAPTRSLYFVADGTGGHVFADTLAEHDANVRKWYAIRRQRGEM
jgi:UPF0755 protein